MYVTYKLYSAVQLEGTLSLQTCLDTVLGLQESLSVVFKIAMALLYHKSCFTLRLWRMLSCIT